MPPADQRGRMKRVALLVVAGTFALEMIGAALLQPMFASVRDSSGRPATAAWAIWSAAFHGISAFCNAGFSLYGRNMLQGVGEDGWGRPLRDHWQVLGVMAPLIVLGGLGFPVMRDCGRCLVNRAGRLLGRVVGRPAGADQQGRLSLHSKIVLSTSAALIVAGAAGLLAVEPPPKAMKVVPGVIGAHPIGGQPIVVNQADWAHADYSRRAREALFQSVSARAGGFNTIDLGELSDAGKLWLSWLMVIGGSPGGAAGGMKTVTFALLLLTAYCALRRRGEVEAFRRSLPAAVVRKAVTLAVLYLALVSLVTLLLSAGQKVGPRFGFVDLLFEACSACGTAGLSTGVTARLTTLGKLVLVGGMFVGRVGPLALAAAWTTRPRGVDQPYPPESVMVG